jgi:hypothetical protein
VFHIIGKYIFFRLRLKTVIAGSEICDRCAKTVELGTICPYQEGFFCVRVFDLCGYLVRDHNGECLICGEKTRHLTLTPCRKWVSVCTGCKREWRGNHFLRSFGQYKRRSIYENLSGKVTIYINRPENRPDYFKHRKTPRNPVQPHEIHKSSFRPPPKIEYPYDVCEILKTHQKELKEDPERLSTAFLKKLISKDPICPENDE